MIFEVPRVYGGRVDWKLSCSLYEIVPGKSQADVPKNLNFVDKNLQNAQESIFPISIIFSSYIPVRVLYFLNFNICNTHTYFVMQLAKLLIIAELVIKRKDTRR